MSRTTFCVTFYIRKTRLNKHGFAPIYLKVTVDNETSACPIPLKVAPQEWNPTQAISMGSEIIDVCGIQKSVSTHTARHTFATYMLSKGASIENVAKMLGHTDTKMTRHYAKILDESIMSDMLKIEEKIRFTLGQ